MEPTLEAIKGFGGYTTTVTLWIFALVTWWKGLPALLSAGSTLIEAYSKRAASIEERLQKSVADQFSRFETTIKDLEQHHKECQEENQALRKRVQFLEDAKFLSDQEITGMKRQLAQYETHGGAPTPVVGALFLPASPVTKGPTQ